MRWGRLATRCRATLHGDSRSATAPCAARTQSAADGRRGAAQAEGLLGGRAHDRADAQLQRTAGCQARARVAQSAPWATCMPPLGPGGGLVCVRLFR